MKLSCMLALALLSTTAAAASNLYTWKDANGVTHYSETPPEGRHYETRRITPQAGVAIPDTAPATAESAQCSNARNNLQILDADGPVAQDTNGDGKPDTPLDESQRAAQKNLAEAAMKAYCTRPTGGG